MYYPVILFLLGQRKSTKKKAWRTFLVVKKSAKRTARDSSLDPYEKCDIMYSKKTTSAEDSVEVVAFAENI